MTQTLPTSLSQWLAHIEHQHPSDIAMGLERVRDVAAALGLGKPAGHVIVVAGTNGKGSTVAFIEAIAQAAGLRVGCYTSPHLHVFNERVRIAGELATDASLVDAFAAVEAARGATALTYFEYATLAALWLFQRSALDLAVLEVGMGGRLDAVNIVDADVAVITTVDVDHQAFLGDDRETIGVEKAGIIRGWKPVVCGEIDPPSSVLRRAYLVGANALRFGSDFFADVQEDGSWVWRDVATRLVLPAPALTGPMQRANAASAIAALQALPLTITESAWADGMQGAVNPGRLEQFTFKGTPVLVDVGHNPHAARALAAALKAAPVAGPTVAVLGMLADKDAHGVVMALADAVQDWQLVTLDGPRGRTASALASALAGTGAADARQHADLAAGLEAALGLAGPTGRVLVCGSFLMAASARELLRTA